MATIGTFKKSGNEFHGEIVRASDKAPSHRLYAGGAEIGAAWWKRSNEGRDYLSVKLDDPSFTLRHPSTPASSRTGKPLP